MNKKILIIKLVVYSIYATSLFAQDLDFNMVSAAFENNNSEKAITELIKIDTLNTSKFDKATWLYYYAIYNFNLDKHHVAYKNVVKAKNIFIALKEEKDAMDCNMLILDIVSHQGNLEIDIQSLEEDVTKYALDNKDTAALKSVYHNLAIKFLDLGNTKESIKYFKKKILLSMLQKDSLKMAYDYMNIGAVCNSSGYINIDSALYYTRKALPILIRFKDNQTISSNYNNQGNVYLKSGNYKESIVYFKKADSVPLDKFINKTKVVFYENLADAYYKNKDYKNASKYLQKQITLQDSINDTQQNIAISDIKEKYDNEKLRADNLVSEAKRIRNRNFLLTALAFLLFSIVTGSLVYTNRLRKHKITEKEKQLEQQKVSNLLKEQELVAIDAMIEGQEKERQLIASDLHDDLGALMATLQLNFDNLNKHRDSKDTEMLFARIKTLIKEAYQKIRSIAHAKNSGVIAKQGFLTAITNNANKISKLNGIKIEVREHGLENNRLENSMELTIFRIVQELITNIVKHADATHAIIHFTNYEDSLNIMVEDDGKGFDTTKITKSKGLGIHSIEKRVELMGGTMIVESILGKGASIIIDVPL